MSEGYTKDCWYYRGSRCIPALDGRRGKPIAVETVRGEDAQGGKKSPEQRKYDPSATTTVITGANEAFRSEDRPEQRRLIPRRGFSSLNIATLRCLVLLPRCAWEGSYQPRVWGSCCTAHRHGGEESRRPFALTKSKASANFRRASPRS